MTFTAAGGSATQSERDRERDLEKYYQPWLDFTAARRVASHHDPEQKPSQDATLTALAQLAALRLNVKRGLVSLVNRHVQIILAEATQTLSLVDKHRHAPGDQIWLGQGSVPRGEGMDEHVFGAEWTGTDANGNEHTLSALVVNDVQSDERFKHRPYVVANPGVKFYAGVPITTKRGHQIGVYSVSDSRTKPEGLSVDQVQFMQDVAQIISDHLDRLKVTIDRERDDFLMRGIASFIEGLSAYKHKLNNPLSHMYGADNKKDATPRATDPQPAPTDARAEAETKAAAEASAPNHPKPNHNSLANVPTSTDPNGLVDYGVSLPEHIESTDTRTPDTPDSSDKNIKQIFCRAAQIIQKGTNAKGCVFLDASSGLFSLAAKSAPSLHKDPASAQREDLESDLDSEPEFGDHVTALRARNVDDEASTTLSQTASESEKDQTAEILGASITGTPTAISSVGFLRRRYLLRFLLRYPVGQVFYLDNDETTAGQNPKSSPTVESAGPGDPRLLPSQRRGSSRVALLKHLPKELLDHIPDAKWLIFLPLFNYAQGQWSAAALIWSDNDWLGDIEAAMPYLRTFGSCIMSEVTSMDALNTNIAKSTFIASISHDLRSPLHGMLGSLEFLEDTLNSAYQMSLLASIETCGKTLLDTIDHLLDYAKITNLNRTHSTNPDSMNERPQTNGSLDFDVTQTSTFDVSLLLEEVVEAVFAGQTFRSTRLRGRDPVDEAISSIHAIGLDDSATVEEQIHAGSAKFSGRVFFILDILKTDLLCVQGQTGAFRRIILNIVGNAIKYCHVGAIEVRLRVEPLSGSKVNVVIDVNDTGVGMSKVFQENHLFKPFSQENSFTPGAGLGLSITSQIVQNLGGKISVQSTKDVGTHVRLTLPTDLSPPGYCDSQDILSVAARVTAGKDICLLNPTVDELETAKGRLSKLTASIARTCQEWFQMTCSQSRTVETTRDSSVYVYCEPPPVEYLLKHHSERKLAGKSGKEAALLIICTNAFEAAALRAAGVSHLISLGRIVEVISQPVGVRKLAKVLLQSFQRVEGTSTDHSLHVGADVTTGAFASGEAQRRASQVEWNSTSLVYDNTLAKHRPSVDSYRWKSDQPQSREPDVGMHVEEPATFGDIKRGYIPGLGSITHKDVASANETSLPPYVLLVDDNAINLKLLVTFMKKIHLPYEEAINGLEAYEKFKSAKRPFDFVLMDLQMPVMDGFESTRKIREYEAEAQVTNPSTIIAITGVGRESTRKEAMDAGISQFLTKPVRFKALQLLLEHQHQS